MRLIEQIPLAPDTVQFQQGPGHAEFEILTLYKAVLSWRNNPLADREAQERELYYHMPDFEEAGYEADEGHKVDLTIGPNGVRFVHDVLTQYVDLGAGKPSDVKDVENLRSNLEQTVSPELQEELRTSYGSEAPPNP